jgi:Pyridine nucleotide-disulphide oxidoreductase.
MIRYDKLLVATGSRPFIPPIKGLDEVKNKFTFMTLDDAKNLEKAITSSSRVLIIGAGLIGLKCAEGIRDKVKSITIIDLADRILPSILDDEPSKIVKAHLERQGLAFILSDSVKSFDSGRAILTGGREIEFDILIIAVGVRPNVELIKEIGGK